VHIQQLSLIFFTAITIFATLYIKAIISMHREIKIPPVNCIGIQIRGISIIENIIENMGCFILILKYKASIAIAIPIRNIIPNTISKNAIVFTISSSPHTNICRIYQMPQSDQGNAGQMTPRRIHIPRICLELQVHRKSTG